MIQIQIIESSHLTVTEKEIVPRTWRERLFTWPWQPWIRTKLVVRTIPDPKVFVTQGLYGNQAVICHPDIARVLREHMGNVWAANDLGDHIDPLIACPRVDRPGA